jgi:hypothetical protein
VVLLKLGEEGRRVGIVAARTGRGPQPLKGPEGGGGTGATSMAGHEGTDYTL